MSGAGIIDQTVKIVREQIDELGMCLRYRGGSLYLYEDGYWRVLDEDDKDRWFNQLVLEACRETGATYGKEEGAILKTLAADVGGEFNDFDDEPFIAVLGGRTIDPRYEEPEVLEWSPDHGTTRKLDIYYDPDATCPQWEAMLWRMLEDKDRSDDDIKQLVAFLQRWFGVNIVGKTAKKNRSMSNGLFIEGPSHTGKTTFSQVFCEFYGGMNDVRVASPSMETLGQQFGKQLLINAMVLAADDAMKEGVKVPTELLKNLIGGGSIQVDRKTIAPVKLSFHGAVLFTGNNLPAVEDYSDGIYNRLHLVQMTRVFTEADQKRDLNGMNPIEFLRKHKEFPGIFNWALEGYRDAMQRRSLAPPKTVMDASRMFRMRNDPVYAFWCECVVPSPHWALNAEAAVEICRQHAMFHTEKKFISRKRAAAQVPRTLLEVHKEAKIETEGQLRIPTEYIGVKLNKHGLGFWKDAKQDNANARSLGKIERAHYKCL
jgi:P4 family phage/plasmid primase-like protien